MALNYDLILKSGEVIDPSQNLRGKRDVGFKGGKVAAVSESLPSEEGAHVIDVSGKMVTPGLIDLHTHFAYNVAPFCVNPDPTYLPLGITTAVDTGTTGWMNFPAFRSLVLERSDANLFAFIHLSSIGTMMPGSIEIPDLADFRFARADEAIRCIKDNRDLVLGVKVRLSPDGTTAEHAVPSLEMARKIADATGSLLMVHVMNSVLPLPQVMEYLKPGDIATHIFQGTQNNILDDKGEIRKGVRAAYDKGVIFDTACFAEHYTMPISKKAIEGGMKPHTLSTDMVGEWPGEEPGYNLLEIMTIYHTLGMSVEEVIQAVTANSAKVIGHQELGSLKPGSVGDAAVLEMEEGSFTYDDGVGNRLDAQRRFSPVITVKEGKKWRLRPTS
jgi:dihydroorotase